MLLGISDELKNLIKRHEGYSQLPYYCTSGKLTIGWGRNLDTVGIDKEEAELLFDDDLQRCQQQLSAYEWYTSQPAKVQYALFDMCFNLGIKKLLSFKRMISALENKDYNTAANEASDSKWASQVVNRAKEAAELIRSANI